MQPLDPQDPSESADHAEASAAKFGGGDALRQSLAGIHVETPKHYRNLTLFPLFVKNGHTPHYTLLEDAIAAGEARVTEEDESGHVPTLIVHNSGARPILIPAGEILVGAKQNRVVNVSVMVAAKTQFRLPVSCVERGRWHYVSHEFKPAYYATPSLRGLKSQSANRNRRAHGEAHSDQMAVWAEVDKQLAQDRVYSPTSSLTDGLASQARHTEGYRGKLKLPAEAAGMLMASADRVLGLDLFDCPRTMARYAERLGEAYYGEALREPVERPRTKLAVAIEFVRQVSLALRPAPALTGAQSGLEVLAEGVAGSGVFDQERLCHLCAFSLVN